MLKELLLISSLAYFAYTCFRVFFLPFWLGSKRDKFRCFRCGNCCRSFYVKPSESEIKRIEKLGYKRGEFLDDKGRIKRIKGECYFLRRNEDGSYSCAIYEARPEVCRKWPFFEFLSLTYCDMRCDCEWARYMIKKLWAKNPMGKLKRQLAKLFLFSDSYER